MEKQKFLTFNYKSFKRASGSLQNMLESVDECPLQEFWLWQSELHFLVDISQDFEITGTSSMDPSRIQFSRP